MFNQTWYYGTIRKYIILFGTLFNDVYINRTNADGETVQTLKIPLTYAPKEKMLSRLQGDPTLTRPVAMQLPIMSFEITGMEYDPARKLNTVNRFASLTSSSKDQQKFQYNPVPYNIFLNLNIMVKNAEDGNRILEQILPFFTPEWTTTLNLVPELDIKYDIPVILDSVEMQDVYDGNFTERRTLIWNLSFVLKGYIFGPVKKQKVIKIATTNFKVPTTNTIEQGIGNTATLEYLTVKPGLLANGLPTSNSSLSISVDGITVDDNYGFIIQFEEA